MRTVERKYKPKFFPFSAGIPWKVERGKYIVPGIDAETWAKVLDGRNIVITVFGGLFESFFSLPVIEGLLSFDSDHQVSWLGHQQFASLVRLQGLAKISTIDFSPDGIVNYPVPIFFDANNNAYFNLLHNYMVRTSYWGKYAEVVNIPATEQIFQNAMIPWRRPNLRHLGHEFIDELSKVGFIRPKSKVVLIIHKPTQNDVLGWNIQNIKEFAQLASHKGLKVIVFTTTPNMFHGSKIIAIEYDMRKIIQTMKIAWMILSTDISWLMIGLLVSEAGLMARQVDNQFDLLKNAEFLKAQNDIFTDRQLISPIDAFTICEGLL